LISLIASVRLIIIVGQNIQGAGSDKRAQETYKDAEAILQECLQLQSHLQAQDKIRQSHLLLPKRREVQSQIPDARLQRQGAPRRRRHVAEFVRAHEADCHRRGKDRSACEKAVR
jgi:hypothetical protein